MRNQNHPMQPISEKEIESFLNLFKEKMKIQEVLFRDERGKNAQALLDLEIRPVEREEILASLKIKEYCTGPIKDTLYNGSDLWVFGRIIKKKEVYIKISMGFPGSGVICISFHIAERKLKFPLK